MGVCSVVLLQQHAALENSYKRHMNKCAPVEAQGLPPEANNTGQQAHVRRFSLFELSIVTCKVKLMITLSNSYSLPLYAKTIC